MEVAVEGMIEREYPDHQLYIPDRPAIRHHPMLARLQQFITVSLLISAGVWFCAFARAGRPAWALLGVVLILLGYALFLAVEFVLLGFVQDSVPAPRATARELLGAWWGEVGSAPRVFCWRQPFRSQAEPDFIPEEPGGRRGVVFVHGFFCNRGFWNPWLTQLRAQQVPFVAVNLEPVFGSMDDYPAIVEAAVKSMEAATGFAPVVVAHSMGGLAVRAWLRKFAADSRVHRVVTIASPHRGTWLARYAGTRSGKQMRQGSAWLAQLAAAETSRHNAYEHFTCFYGHCDNIVFPASTATLPGADNLHIPRTAHVHMAFQAAVFDEVWRWITLPPPRPGGESEPAVAAQ